LLIEFIDLYSLVIGLQAYALHFMTIFVLICTVGINAVREVVWWWTWVEWFSVRGHSILKFGAVRWRCCYYGDDVLNFAVTSKTVACGHSPSFGIGRIFLLHVV